MSSPFAPFVWDLKSRAARISKNIKTCISKMAESLNDLKWQLKVAKSVAGRTDMSTKKKNEWKKKARVLEKKVKANQTKEDRKNKLKKR